MNFLHEAVRRFVKGETAFVFLRVTLWMDVCGGIMRMLWQDLRFGARMLLKKPGFTLIAVLTLALGIGACTAIFSIVDAVLLRSMPYPEAERIVQMREVNEKGRPVAFTDPNFRNV